MGTSQTSILTANRSRIAAGLPEHSIAIFLSAFPKLRNGDSEYPYCQSKNFYLMTGYEHPGAIFVMVRGDSTFEEILFIEEISAHDAHWFGHRPTISDVQSESGITKCLPILEFHKLIGPMLKRSITCYIDYYSVPLDTWLPQELQFQHSIASRYPHLKFMNANTLVNTVREQKQDWEIDRIERAISVTRNGLLGTFHAIHPGMLEYQLQAYLLFHFQIEGCNVAFQPIIATGPNATVLHYTSLKSEILHDHLVLLDVGAEYLHYSADVTRTIPASGRFSDFQKSLYSVVLEANKATINAVRPGVTFKELNALTRKTLADGLLKLNIISNAEEIGKYFTHGVSHMLGLDTHDVASNPGAPLIPGMVITVEPGLYLQELGIGIRIEDDILVTQTGFRNLSDTIPKEIHELEVVLSETNRSIT